LRLNAKDVVVIRWRRNLYRFYFLRKLWRNWILLSWQKSDDDQPQNGDDDNASDDHFFGHELPFPTEE
jgi:hypothetical protein